MKLFGRATTKTNRSCHKCMKPATQEFYKQNRFGQPDMSSRVFSCEACSPRQNAA